MDLSKIIPNFKYKNIKEHDSTITKETRQDSYQHVSDTLGERQKNVYQTLQVSFPDGATAKELAVLMYEGGLVGSPERNSVHPRLNELIEKGLVKVIGKKTCIYTERKVAIYQNK